MYLKGLCTVLVLLVCSSVLLPGCSHRLGPAGRVYTEASAGGGSGVYVGNGYMLTNWHVAENIPEKANLFSMSSNDYFATTVVIPIEKVLFSTKEIELALVRLIRPVEDSHIFSKVCLSRTPVRNGEHLTIVSSPHGYFPPERVTVTVTDDRPRLRPDSDKTSDAARKVITIVALTPEHETQLVAPGSSGGAVLNQKGELVGLVWGANLLKSGDVEAWITPVSEWWGQLERKADMSDRERQVMLNIFCE